MCLKKVRLFPVFFMLLFIASGSFAQQNGAGIKLFFEKVYLHTDRNFYAGGDDIWFKAYLVNGQSNYPVSTSNTLYTELINPADIIIARQVIRMDSGYGVGDFKLDDSIAGGSYRIRAYTNWMRNFGNHFIFEKQVMIKNIPGVNKKNELPQKNKDHTASTFSTPGYSIQFFPEGGSMVEGIASLVSFKATDASGNGVDASGAIISAGGDTVAHFKTEYAGMGSFNFAPVPGMQYKALVTYQHGGLLPASFAVAAKDGYTMQVTDMGTDMAQVHVFANAATTLLHPSGEITIAAKYGGRILYKEKLTLKDNQAALNIATTNFPTGICSITVYDDSLHPNCERLIYVQDKNPLIVNVTTNKNTYAEKEKVTVNISVTNKDLQPVKANLSLAAVDDNVEKAVPENMATYLLLQTEVKGKIENAAAYFDVNNPLRLQQLDLLLRTQGWRDFLWRKMADTTIAIHFMPEQGISISGNVKQKFSQKPLPGMNITLQAPNAKGDKWFTTRSDAQGNYFLDGIPLYGVQTLKLSSKNDKAEKGGELFMDSLFSNKLPVSPNKFIGYDTTAFMGFAQDAGKRYATEKNNKWFTILPGVTVDSKKKTEFLRDGAYMSFGYPVDNFDITAADYKYDDLRNFLGKKVPGAYYDMENDAIYFMANGKKIRPRFVVDKREDVFDRIDYYSLPMQQVSSVTVRHLVGRPSFERTEREDGTVRDLGASPTDIFIVSLVLKPGAYNNDPAKIITEVTGYYEAKVFYAPNYSVDKAVPDERTTIHWAPLISTNENGKATISFYNADPKTTVRIDVQGVTNKGNVIVAEKKYTVQ
ncbi:hypothetical protein [Ferruginibacter sp. SUN106]|uniref:hypothetical protein n=1 Tax=Ferruginibacter sp. SUN106 TaxID=2978348 RepID=UPI003D35C60B